MIGTRKLTACLLAALAMQAACAWPRLEPPDPASPPAPERVIPHARWEAHPPLGHVADAMRRNRAPGDSLTLHALTVTVLGTAIDSIGATPVDVVRLRLATRDSAEERVAREGSAFNWNGYHIAVVAIYGQGELGGGLVALEAATLASLPAEIATSDSAGGAAMRLRVPHRITHVTLHHTAGGILHPEDDPAQRLRDLQSWGARERIWWDVPYHYLLDLEGRIYEGRDWRFMGETNTVYDPGGHFLISVMGDYEQQQPTPAQLEAIVDLMAWAVRTFDVPLERIGGHFHYARTSCPGQHLRRYLEDGTFRRMVEQRLSQQR